MSQEVADSVSEKERKRQEAINEVIYTERDFVRDMEYLRDVSSIPETLCPQGCSEYSLFVLDVAMDYSSVNARHHPREQEEGFRHPSLLERPRNHRSQYSPS